MTETKSTTWTFDYAIRVQRAAASGGLVDGKPVTTAMERKAQRVHAAFVAQRDAQQ